jgi:hypothetical protein
LEPSSLTFKIFEDKVMTKTALKSAMQHGEDAITLLTEDHKKEEEEKMFPKAKKAKVDTAALGAALIQRKHELQAKPSRSRPKRAR